jgi:hypothetical protein
LKSSLVVDKSNKVGRRMSLDDAPAPTLKIMKGRLENIETAWTMASNLDERREINEEFKALAEEIKRGFGEDGTRVVNDVVAKHKALNFRNGH